MELLVVVMIIGILMAISVPAVAEQMRDRRTQRAAQEIASLYREARSRSVGRGAAHLVRYTSIAGRIGNFEVFESVQAAATTPAALAGQVGACSSLPMASCALGTWPAAGAQGATGANIARLIAYFPDAGVGDYATTQTSATDSLFDICFSPSGRMFSRATTAVPFAPVTDVPAISVQRKAQGTGALIGLTRRVLLLPNGAVRLEL